MICTTTSELAEHAGGENKKHMYEVHVESIGIR